MLETENYSTYYILPRNNNYLKPNSCWECGVYLLEEILMKILQCSANNIGNIANICISWW